MTKTYELMVVAKPDFEGADPKKAQALIKKLVGVEGTVKEVSSLGKKPLAYPILKFTEGQFLLATVDSGALKVGDLEKRRQLEGGEVLRFLLTVKEE